MKLYVGEHPVQGDWYVFDGEEERENYRLARPYAGPFATEADATAYLNDKVRMISNRFVTVLRHWLTADEWNEMASRNAAEPDGASVCHSHDFCDANMAMHEAFTEVMGREPFLLDDGDDPVRVAQHDADIEMFNAAWEQAKPRLKSRIVWKVKQ